MANSPIVFIGQQPSPAWLTALREAMPRETVVADDACRASEAEQVQVAVVANPAAGQLARYTNLKWIHSVWAGVEQLVPIAAARKLPLVRLVDPALAQTMAEAVLAWTLYLHRDMPTYAAQQRQRVWHPQPYVAAHEINVCILGLGALGRAAAGRLLAAGYQVSGWSQSRKDLDGVATYTGEAGLHAALADANIVVVLLPLTAQTKHLLDAKRFTYVRNAASIINFARGAVVDCDALLAALEAGKLRHAVLDVFETEPLSAESALWAHPKITILPHISAPTNRHTAAAIVAANVAAYRASGVIPAAVDPVRGY
jgi:glyoxylate/hydroxypyruvate reductase